jgi:Zn-dependent protease
MRDPMSWSIPAFRAFGVQVRIHIFFFIIAIGLFLRQITLPQYDNVWWLDIFLLTVVVLFVSVLLHEFGHCFGARYVGGEARDILIWPLGGLAFTDVPHRWRALFTTVAAGPAVNLLICLFCAAVIAVSGYLPNLNPFADPYRNEITSYRHHRTEGSHYAGVLIYKPGTNEQPSDKEIDARREAYKKQHGVEATPRPSNAPAYRAYVAEMGFEWGVAPAWVVWAQRIFWLNWLLFLFNLIPAYPLDGGQMLQALVWARTDHRRGVVVASYTGFAFAILFLIVSIAANEALFLGLALFMLYSASVKLMQLETEEGPFGYDFSAGYTSLEKDDDDEPAPRPKRPGYVRRWLDARKARRIARETEQRQREDERVDELLEKIARSGKGSLTEEEKRFLERVSARRRNTS